MILLTSLVVFTACTVDNNSAHRDIDLPITQVQVSDLIETLPQSDISQNNTSKSTFTLFQDQPEIGASYSALYTYIESASNILWIGHADIVQIFKKYNKELLEYQDFFTTISLGNALSWSLDELTWDQRVIALIDRYEIFFIKNLSWYNPNLWPSQLRRLAVGYSIQKITMNLELLDNYMLPDWTIVQKELVDSYKVFAENWSYTDYYQAVEDFNYLSSISIMTMEDRCEDMLDWPDKENCMLIRMQ